MILIAIGANLLTKSGALPQQSCREAVERLRLINGLHFEACSRWYVSAPIPRSDQPDYINGVARFSGRIDPASLLGQLHAIEQEFGRHRSEINAARTLDLDLLDADGVVSAGPVAILPHPRLHQRAFVLRPLLDVAPDWVHPSLGEAAVALLAALPPQQIEPLSEPEPLHRLPRSLK